MPPTQCPQCGQARTDPALACSACGYDPAERRQARTNRILTLTLLVALLMSVTGAVLVFFSRGTPASNQSAVGYMLFLAGFIVYVVARVIILIRQRRR